jgi:carbon-monoxide dehydrogenase medium subunit
MYPSNFDYLRASSIAETGELLRQHPGAKILAGGHSLIPMLKLRLTTPATLIDIGRIAELKGITLVGGSLRVGALTTHAELVSSPLVREHVPALTEAADQVGDPAVRNRGTIGGNVAHADPASDLPTVLTALEARFELVGEAGVTTCTPATFFQGMMATAVGEHDVLTAIEIPIKTAGQGMSYVKFDHPASRYAVIGVAAVLTVAGGRCTAASVAVGGLVPKPVRASSVEQALVGQPLSAENSARAADLVANDLGHEILGDIYASADYRKAVVPVYVKRALTAATERVV